MNNIEEQVSIIVPVYNVEKYLKRCLDSIINQTYKNFKVICVDDGSTDNSLRILEEYANKDSRIQIISQENQGLAQARNKGLEYVSTPYCYFLDSDDYIEPNLLEHAMTIFQNFDIDYFCFGSKAFIEDNNIIQNIDNMQNYLSIKRDGLYNINFDIAKNTNIHVWNKIFKTELIKAYDIKFIKNLLYEDIYFMWYYNFVSKKAYFETRVLHNYRMRSTSIMEEVTNNKKYQTAVHHMYNWHELMLRVSQDFKLFDKNYKNLLQLLDMYNRRSKEFVPWDEKYKIEKLKQEYLSEIQYLYKSKKEQLLKQLQ